MEHVDTIEFESSRSGKAQTIAGLIARHAELTPDAPGILAPGCAPVTYGELFSRLKSACGQFRTMGISRKDRVALVAPNGPGAAEAFLCLACTCGCAPLNPAYKIEEFEFYLRDLGARALVTTFPPDSPVRIAARNLELQTIQMIAAHSFCRFESGVPGPARDDCPVTADDIALLLHTSGTTSKPKLVPLLHRNLCASAQNIGASLALTSADRCLNIMPLFHIHGLVAAILSSLAAGGSIICTDGTYGTGFFQRLKEFSPTWYTAVPTMHMAILAKARENAPTIASHPLRFIRSSSSALPPQILHALENAFHTPVVEAYGMTEAAHQMSSNPLPPRTRKAGSVGPEAGPEIAVMDAGGNLLDQGARGEVVIRGPNLMPGYLGNPQANHAAFADGWFRTGDEGWIDPDGYLFLTGRLKELINRGGEKISPREVDEILLDHPDVKQSLAFGIPHVQLGEEVGAAVVLAQGSMATESSLRQFAAARLAPFKVPRLIRILDEIPKGPTGKPQRIGLASRLGIAALDTNQSAAEYQAPISPLEERICGIWRELLQCGPVGTRDSFFLLGGDSLLAAQMLAVVGEAVGSDVPFAEFLSQGTVASLVQEITNEGQGGTTGSPIVPFRTEGSRPPLVCIPGHDGILIGFSNLTRLLGPDQPIYALKAPQPSAFPPDDWNVVSFASRYADVLSERFQKRPIYLTGICFGGIVAYEVARQLVQGGATIQSLVLMDTLNPQWKGDLGPGPRLKALAAMIFERGAAHARMLCTLQGRGIVDYLKDRARAFMAGRGEDRELNRMRSAPGSAPSKTAVLRRLAAAEYQPGPYSGPIHMIRVRGLRPNAPMMGWASVVSGKVSIAAVDFCPRGLMADPAIATVARFIAEVTR